jgi:putative heme-binding domain-containing protein
MQAMLAYANRLPALLDALEAGTVRAHEVPAARRAALLNHADEKLRARTAKLLGAGETAASRKEVLDRYAAALQLTGDVASGRKVYEANCAACHKLGDLGHDVGPNLATVRQWGPEQLLVNILDPNREVGPDFAEYVVQLKDGETLSGIVAEENVTSITLKMTGGAQRVLPRGDVKRIAASRVSLMPEGLEAGITSQGVADLIAFLRATP